MHLKSIGRCDRKIKIKEGGRGLRQSKEGEGPTIKKNKKLITRRRGEAKINNERGRGSENFPVTPTHTLVNGVALMHTLYLEIYFIDIKLPV